MRAGSKIHIFLAASNEVGLPLRQGVEDAGVSEVEEEEAFNRSIQGSNLR